MKTFLLVDGHALIHRAYFAIPPFKTRDGFPTNAIYGFFTILHKAINDFNPSYLCIFFDTPKPTFRKKMFANYQIHRPKTQDDMKIQIPKLKDILKSGGIYQLEKDGFEADDLIGTVVNKTTILDVKKIILTGDKDIFQLVDPKTFVVTPQIGYASGMLYDEALVLKKMQVSPVKIPDYKALAGDQSDNYSGAKGIGPKTASKLINDYNDIENIYKKIDEIQNKNIVKILLDQKENILISKKLAIIDQNVSLKFDIKYAIFEGFNDNIKTELIKLGMVGLIQRLFKARVTIDKNTKEEKQSKDKQINLF